MENVEGSRKVKEREEEREKWCKGWSKRVREGWSKRLSYSIMESERGGVREREREKEMD